jgi:hypothetical protein
VVITDRRHAPSSKLTILEYRKTAGFYMNRK